MTTAPAWRDPIVAEIHAIREHLAERFHNDLAAYSETADAHCRALGFYMVPFGADRESNTHLSHSDPSVRLESATLAIPTWLSLPDPLHRPLPEAVLTAIRDATNGGFAPCNERLSRQISIVVGRRTWHGTSGRPKSRKPDADQLGLPL